MRPSQNHPRLNSPTNGEPTPGRLDFNTPRGADESTRPIDAMESALTALQERVNRLEGDVRNLQSQNLNRS